MKKILVAAVCSAALLVLPGSAHACRFALRFDAGPEGLTIAFTRGFLTQTVMLTDTQDPPQRLRLMPGLSVDLSLTSLGPDDRRQLTLHYILAGVLTLAQDREGDFTLPYEHGYITNKCRYDHGDPDLRYDLQGAALVLPFKSAYSLQFGLEDLSSLIVAQADPQTNDIHQTIYRDNGDLFADINLAFHPRLLYSRVDFAVSMTPQSDTGQDPYPDPTAFTGTLPVPYGVYHLWFYRDSKN